MMCTAFPPKNNEMYHMGYTSFHDPAASNSSAGVSTNNQDGKNKFSKESLRDLERLLQKTFYGDEGLPDESSRTL